MVIDFNWMVNAACLDADKELFFVPDTEPPLTPEEVSERTKEAKAICNTCPVKRKCLESALENEDRFGVWGGADEKVIRQALSIDQFGHPTDRARAMRCPYCNSTDLRVPEHTNSATRKRVICNECDLQWWARKRVVHKTNEEKVNDGELV